MISLIQKWMTKRLGKDFDYTMTSFAEKAKDGKLITEILCNYNIITQEQYNLIEETDDRTKALANFNEHILRWLNSIHISCDESEIREIVEAKGTIALNLFYKVYLELADKSKLHFELLRRVSEKLRPDKTRFTVSAVRSSDQQFKIPENPLFEFVTEGWDIINWYQDKFAQLQRKMRESKQDYHEYIRKRASRVEVPQAAPCSVKQVDDDIPKTEIEDDSSSSYNTISYTVLIEEQEKAKQMESFKPKPKESKRILNEIKAKHKKDVEGRIFKEKAQTELLSNLWTEIQRKQEDEFMVTIFTKMKKQSMYEKQMVTKLLEARHQRKVIAENRMQVEEEVQKQRDAELEHSFFMQEKQEYDKKSNYYRELQRANELHDRLYAEKLRLRRLKHEELCRDTVNSMVDYAIRWHEYKHMYMEDPPKFVEGIWKALFFEGKSILAVVKPVEDIIQYDEDLPEDMEELYFDEIERQNCIDQKCFEDYMELQSPFDLVDIEYTEETLSLIDRGTNILGYIVHRLLLRKYPLPPLPPKLDLPNIEVAACVDGIEDTTILPVLEQLLLKNKIQVIEVQHAINYCLEAYKSEIKPEDFDEIPINKPESALLLPDVKKKSKKKKKDKKDKKDKKKKDKKKGKKSKLKDNKKELKTIEAAKEESMIFVLKIDHKYVQTPKWLPGEDIHLSNKAELGRIAYEELNFGKPLSDYLVVALLVEYLKSLPDIKGFVLINYPTRCEEAALLEEQLTGMKVPGTQYEMKFIKSIVDMMDLDELPQDDLFVDYDELRKSKLLPNPIPIEEPPEYKTYFTAYIVAKQIPKEVELGEQTLPPVVEEFANIDFYPSKFYSEQGCLYYMYYKVFDFTTIKHLGKLIIGDYTLPIKASVELFGEDIQYMETDWEAYKLNNKPTAIKEGTKKKKGKKDKKIVIVKPQAPGKEKKSGKDKSKKSGKSGKSGKSSKSSKSKKSDKSSKGSKGKKGKKGKKGAKEPEVPKVFEEKEVQVPEAEEEECEIEYILEPREPLPGEQGWQYINLPIPEHIEIALASIWEAIERVYCSDLKENFFLSRVVLSGFMPYLSYVRELLNGCMERPDTKQLHVTDFQLLYNSIDEDLRDDEEMKAELHCRISEFGEKLKSIADNNMVECEDYRRQIIDACWIPVQICELLQYCVNACQLEVDRCVGTLQLLSDYYTAMVFGTFCEDPKLLPTELPKLNCEDENQVKSFSMDINKSLTNFDDIDMTAVTAYFNSIKTRIHNYIQDCATKCYSTVKKTEGYFHKGKASGKGKGKGKKKSKEVPPENLIADDGKKEQIKENMSRLVSEWKTAIDGEIARVKLRVDVLNMFFSNTYKSKMSFTRKVFQQLHGNIKDKYDREIEGIDTVCDLFARATELEVPIEPELILGTDEFHVNLDNVLYEKLPDTEPDPLPQPQLNENIFTINQLLCIVTVLKDLAPNGLIPERSFIYFLADLLVDTSEDGSASLLPKVWRKLKPGDLNILSEWLFDRNEYIQWKEFIIYNLPINCPTSNDILRVRALCRQYDPDITETIEDYQFYTMRLWFDDMPQTLDALINVKRLLFKMYGINESTMNYTAMLLDFCKDEYSYLGLAKALELCIGKQICHDRNLGNEYLSALYKQKAAEKEIIRQQKIQQKLDDRLIREIITELVDRTVHECDSVIIEDVSSTFDSIALADFDFTNTSKKKEALEELHVVFSDSDNVSVLESVIDRNEVDLKSLSNYRVLDDPEISIEEFPDILYTLELEPIVCVITAAIPWHSRVQNIGDQSFREIICDIYEECKNEDFNNAVFSHDFLHNKRLNDLLKETNKFLIQRPEGFIQKLLGKL